jgi:hypothetical protein
MWSGTYDVSSERAGTDRYDVCDVNGAPPIF